MRILILDNYDSFVYNIIGLLQRIEAEGRFPGLVWDVCLNDAVDIEQIPYYDAVILSPGPGLPSEAGCMPEILLRYAHAIPMLGICLGFQAIAERFGARLRRLPSPRHGHMSRLSGIDRDDPVTGGWLTVTGRWDGITRGLSIRLRCRKSLWPPHTMKMATSCRCDTRPTGSSEHSSIPKVS